MKKKAIFIIILLFAIGCKKKAPKTHPKIVGTWHLLKWCDTNNYPKKDFNVNAKGKGSYQAIYTLNGKEDQYSGIVKTKRDDFFIRKEYIFSIVSITDTVAILKNPYAPSPCGKDEISISGLLKVRNKNGDVETYWKQ